MRKENRNRLMRLPLLLALLACGAFVFSSGALGDHKPGHSPPGQGGGGDDDGGSTASYTVLDLGAAGNWSSAYSINNSNEIVGNWIFGTSGGVGHAVYWNVDLQQGISTSLLPEFAGAERSESSDINDFGEVVGHCHTGEFNDDGISLIEAVLWRFDEQAAEWVISRPLGTLGGENSLASAINDFGEVVGVAQTPDAEVHAFLLVPEDLDGDGQLDYWADDDMDGINDLMIDMGPGWANAVNNLRQVVGRLGSDAVLWQLDQTGAVTTHYLGALGGDSSTASAINDFGEIAGRAETTNGERHAALWEVDVDGFVTGVTDLGTTGDSGAIAGDINHADPVQIVGYSSSEIPGPRIDFEFSAFVWSNGQISDLNDLIPNNSKWELETAAINDAGIIVGRGTIIYSGNDWEPHAYLLVPN